LIEFETRKVASIAPNIAITGMATAAGHRQRGNRHLVKQYRVISMVPDTAMP